MFGAVLGLLLLGEKMMLHGWSGVFLLCTGIALVATDPGDKVEEEPAGAVAVEKEAPPLIIWIGPALICASAYGAFAAAVQGADSLLWLFSADEMITHLWPVHLCPMQHSITSS